MGMNTPDPEALALLREHLKPGQTWHAYRDECLDSRSLGDYRFLLVGPAATYAVAPPSFPDSHLGIGWRFRHWGTVDLETGTIVERANNA